MCQAPGENYFVNTCGIESTPGDFTTRAAPSKYSIRLVFARPPAPTICSGITFARRIDSLMFAMCRRFRFSIDVDIKIDSPSRISPFVPSTPGNGFTTSYPAETHRGTLSLFAAPGMCNTHRGDRPGFDLRNASPIWNRREDSRDRPSESALDEIANAAFKSSIDGASGSGRSFDFPVLSTGPMNRTSALARGTSIVATAESVAV